MTERDIIHSVLKALEDVNFSDLHTPRFVLCSSEECVNIVDKDVSGSRCKGCGNIYCDSCRVECKLCSDVYGEDDKRSLKCQNCGPCNPSTDENFTLEFIHGLTHRKFLNLDRKGVVNELLEEISNYPRYIFGGTIILNGKEIQSFLSVELTVKATGEVLRTEEELLSYRLPLDFDRFLIFVAPERMARMQDYLIAEDECFMFVCDIDYSFL